MSSKAFGSLGPVISHLNKGEIADLRSDTEVAFLALENRSGYPMIEKVTAGSTVSLAALPVSKAIVGQNFMQDQTKAALTLGTGTSSLAFTANRPGTPGNNITVAIVAGVSTLSVASSGSAITITLADGGSTASDIKTAMDAAAGPNALAQVAISGGGGGTITAAVGATNLAGGTGLGFEVLINNVDQVIRGAVTETALPLRVSNLTGYANTDTATIRVRSNGRMSDAISIDVVT